MTDNHATAAIRAMGLDAFLATYSIGAVRAGGRGLSGVDGRCADLRHCEPGLVWIYIPSACVPASACLTSDLKPDSAILESWREQSLTSSGKPMPRASLLRSWKQGSYIRRLSGLTLEPSTADLSAAAWISSLRETRAKATASPESAAANSTIAWR